MIAVDNHVPVPSSKSKYPFKTMAVGDSFEIPQSNYHPAQVSSQYYKRHGKQFTWRKQANGSYRCWRTA